MSRMMMMRKMKKKKRVNHRIRLQWVEPTHPMMSDTYIIIRNKWTNSNQSTPTLIHSVNSLAPTSRTSWISPKILPLSPLDMTVIKRGNTITRRIYGLGPVLNPGTIRLLLLLSRLFFPLQALGTMLICMLGEGQFCTLESIFLYFICIIKKNQKDFNFLIFILFLAFKFIKPKKIPSILNLKFFISFLHCIKNISKNKKT